MSRLSRSLKYIMKESTHKLGIKDRIIEFIDNLWFEIILEKIKYYKIKNFINNLRWMLQAAWEFRPWDNHYNIELFAKSLEITGKSLIKYGFSVNAKKEGRRAIFAAHTLRKAYEADWTDDKSAYYLFQQNPLEFENGRMHRQYKHSKEFYEKLEKVINKRVDATMAKNKKDAWAYIHKYIEHWWD